MNKYLLAFGLAFLTFFGCKDPEPVLCESPSLELVFKANYDGEPLVLSESNTYTYYDGTPISITNVRFFVAQLSLKKGTELTTLSEVEDVDFFLSQRTLEGANKGQTFSYAGLNEGEYDGLKLGLGLTPSQNAQTPSSFNSDHPLGNDNNEYWDGWDSYIFAKVEGKQDSDGDNVLESFSYHVGFDEMFRDKELNQAFSIKSGECTTLTVDVDVKRIFSNGTETIDIVNSPVMHSDPNNQEAWSNAILMMDNLVEAISLK